MSIRFVALALASLLLAACATGGSRNYGHSDGFARCYDCGQVERIERVYGQRESGGGGAVLGGIIGGVLGNQVGGGSGRTAATVAGAIAGGMVGNELEKDSRSASRYELFIQMDDGRRIVVTQPELNGIRQGSYVRITGNRARLL
ncbi:MAG: glycine zipper 2TM domain-containing protein [Aquimonas sp.]|nr:glycine zipper 2TM domain-containing protein [Aquimonas sp.]